MFDSERASEVPTRITHTTMVTVAVKVSRSESSHVHWGAPAVPLALSARSMAKPRSRPAPCRSRSARRRQPWQAAVPPLPWGGLRGSKFKGTGPPEPTKAEPTKAECHWEWQVVTYLQP